MVAKEDDVFLTTMMAAAAKKEERNCPKRVGGEAKDSGTGVAGEERFKFW